MATTASSYPREGAYAGDLAGPHSTRRISWGAVIAGIVVVLVVQMALMLLGLAIGTATIDPAAADTPQATTLGLGGAAWWLGATAVSVFLGAWVAGRLAGQPSTTDGMLHGVVTWAAATLVAIYLLSTAIGGLVGGAFGALGSAAQALGQGGQSLASGAMQVLPDNIRGQAQRLFDQGPAAAGQAQQAAQQAAGGGSTVDAVQRIVRGVQDGASPQDRDAALNLIAQQAGVPRDEAERRLNEFQATYRDYSQRAAEQARQAAQAAAETVSQVSFWSVVALVVGAILAAIGGRLGTPRDDRRYVSRSPALPGGKRARSLPAAPRTALPANRPCLVPEFRRQLQLRGLGQDIVGAVPSRRWAAPAHAGR